MIAVVRVTMIVLAYLLSPLYGVWLLTGVWADRQDRRRFAAAVVSRERKETK